MVFPYFHLIPKPVSYPEVVQCLRSETLTRDIFSKVLDYRGVLLHGDHRSRDELAVATHGEMP